MISEVRGTLHLIVLCLKGIIFGSGIKVGCSFNGRVFAAKAVSGVTV